MTEYYATIDNSNYKPNPRIEFRGLTRKIRSCGKSFRKKIPAVLIGAIFLVALVAVPLDLRVNLFTPAYVNDGETFSHAYPYVASDVICLFITSNWTYTSGQPGFVSEYRFYRLAQTQYTLRPALLPLTRNITIPNPTSVNLGSVSQPNNFPDSAYSISFKQLDPNVGSVSVNASKNIQYVFMPSMNNFTTLNIQLTDKRPSSINMTYWKQIAPSVSIENSTAYKVLENGTYLENYTYFITNNEKVPLLIKSLDFDRLYWDYAVDLNSTKVYVNGTVYGQVAPHTTDNRTLYFQDLELQNGSSLTLTLSFLSNGF